MAARSMIRVDQIVVPLHQDSNRSRRGDMMALAEDVAKNGMQFPILVTKDHMLIDGARRLALFRPEEKVSIQVITKTDDVFAQLARAGKHPLALPYDARRVFDLHAATDSFRKGDRAALSREARARNKAGISVATPKSRGINPFRLRMAELTGHNPHFIQTATWMYGRLTGWIPMADDKNREIFALWLDKLESGSVGIYGLYHRLRRLERETKLDSKPDRVQSAPAQRRVLSEATSSLRGISRALEHLTSINDKITTEEAAQWYSELYAARTQIYRAMRKLKERERAT